MVIRLGFGDPDAKGGDFPLFEPGEYPFTIFEIEEKTGNTSGAPYLAFTFKHAESEQRLWRNFSLQPQSLWAIKRLLIEIGAASASDLDKDFDFKPKDILGAPVLLTVIKRKFEGEDKNEVTKVKAGAAAGAKGKGGKRKSGF